MVCLDGRPIFYLLGICFVKIKILFTRMNVCNMLNTPKIEGDVVGNKS